jgi:hypothetical protein
LLNSGAFGDGMGAQYLLEWLPRKHPPLGAVASLDATLELTPRDQGNAGLLKRIAKLPPQTLPVLIAAPADGRLDFSVWDRYLPCRTDVAPALFRHRDFLLHGVLSRAYRGDRYAEVRARYDQLARVLLAFFDASLKSLPGPWQRLLQQPRSDFRIAQYACPAGG